MPAWKALISWDSILPQASFRVIKCKSSRNIFGFVLLFIIYQLWKVILMCFDLGRGCWYPRALSTLYITVQSFDASPEIIKVCWPTFCKRFMRFLWVYAFSITFFLPYKRAGTHFSIHPAKRQYIPRSKKKPEKLRKPSFKRVLQKGYLCQACSGINR